MRIWNENTYVEFIYNPITSLTIGTMMKSIFLMALALLLTSCTLQRHYVDLEYKPCMMPQGIVGAENIEVCVNVYDFLGQENVVCKLSGFDRELVHIVTNQNVAEILQNAITWELQQRGFTIAYGGKNIEIEICKFRNNFKAEAFSISADSETILNVTMNKNDGMILYAKTVIGCGEEASCFRLSGKNTSMALERSLYDAVQKLVNDPEFIWMLSSN